MAGGLVRDGTVALDHDNNSRLAGGDNMGVMAAPKRLTIGNVAMISSPSGTSSHAAVIAFLIEGWESCRVEIA